MNKIFVLIMMLLLFGASNIPIISGNTDNIGYMKSSLGVVDIFGLFPQIIGNVIVYLSVSPFEWKTIYKDYFHGSFGLFIQGTYNASIPPNAKFIYLPSKDVLRVEGNPFFFKSTSTDLDGEIIEEWWKFNDSEQWLETKDPYYVFTANRLPYPYTTLQACPWTSRRIYRICHQSRPYGNRIH